jgi:type VI secretion system secreted protein VgrG
MNAPRLLQITSPLGPDVLFVRRLSVTEQLGLPFQVEVEVTGLDSELQASALLTKAVTVTVEQSAAGAPVKRHFNGLVSEFARLGPGPAAGMTYKLVLVPGIWRLSLKRNCRIFQDKTAQDIVNAVLEEHAQPAPNWGILPALEPIPYCTQFNETDLQFVSRLLEEHGMTYYFTHSTSAHTLCISATAQGFPNFEGGDVNAAHNSSGFFDLSGWRRSNRARSGSTHFEDMDAERYQPSETLTRSSVTRCYADEPTMWDTGTNFHWPGGMSTRPGVDSAAVAMGEQETLSEDYAADARDPRFVPGARMAVTVQAEDGSSHKQQYVVTSVWHNAEEHSSMTAGAGGTESYQVSLGLVATARTWMPAARHPRPVMAAIYSATVTGPAGEQIHVDEYGRIKVKFRWDHLGKDDDTSSCWVRVAQSAAGAWGGTWFLPRVGDEVLVAFLDADPDRPVVTGSVYGKDAKPPFAPGANRSQSGVRTRSYKSDSAGDANILRFEDKKGEEEVLVHAQKDLMVEIENDETRTVGHDQTKTVQNARTVTIKASNDSLTLEQGNRSTELKTGNDALTLDQGNLSHAIKMGNVSVKCDLGSITLEAMQTITLKVGQNTVVIDQSGVTVKGIVISEEAQGIHKTKGPLVQVNADAMVQVQGGVVMLN